MRLGIGSYTYPWSIGIRGRLPARPMLPLDLLHQARALGVSVAQFCDNQPLTALAEADLRPCRAYAREHGITIELGTRGLQTANLLAHLELAQQLGASFVRLVIDAAGEEPTPQQTVQRLEPIVAAYARRQVKLAIENHDRFTARTLAGIIEELGPARVGVCLDTVNSFGALEGPEVVVATLAPYTLNLHVKDFTIRRVNTQMGFEIAGCPAGQGHLDVPWLLRRLREAGRDVNAILELWTPAAQSLEATIEREQAWAVASVRYLRQLIPN